MSCEALAKCRFHGAGRSDPIDRDSDAQRSHLLRRQRLHQPGDPVRGAAAHRETWRGDYLQQGCGGLCGKADVSLDDPVANQRLSGALRAAAERRDGRRGGRSGPRGAEQRRRAVGARTTSACGPCSATASEHQLAARHEGYRARLSMGAGPPIHTSAACPTAVMRLSSWRSAIRLISTASSPAPRPTIGLPLVRSGRPLGRRSEPKRGKASKFSTPRSFRALHAAVMAACADENGVIKDPRACTFDPASMPVRRRAPISRAVCTESRFAWFATNIEGRQTRTAMACSTAASLTGPNWLGPIWLVMPAADAAAPADSYAAGIGLAFLNEMAFMHKPPGKYAAGLSAVHRRDAPAARAAGRRSTTRPTRT